MKIPFWLLDIDYEMVDGRPEVHLWGLDQENRRILAIDRTPVPYFYLVLEKDRNPGEVVQSILSQKKSLREISNLETVDRRYYGKPLKAIKVMCKTADYHSIARLARKLTKTEGVEMSLENDIRFSTQYLLDAGVTTCGWHELEGEEIENTFKARVDGVCLLSQPPRPIEKVDIPALKILAFSFICHDQQVLILSINTDAGETRNFMADDTDDKLLLEDFISFLNEYDPDIIFGYGSDRQWHYLRERAKNLGLILSVDRMGTEPHTNIHGHISVTGRANIDLLDLTQDLQQVKGESLYNVGRFLGVDITGEQIEEMDIPALWGSEGKRPILLEYTKANALRVMGIGKAMLDYALELSHLVGLPLDYVGKAATGFRVENYLLRETRPLGELAPKRMEHPYLPYTGGMVMAPKPGIHEDVAVLDFKSLYPNLMILYNLSPDTYVGPKEDVAQNQVYVAPEVGHRFRKMPVGFYKQILTHLIEARDEIRKKMKTISERSLEYRLLDARQKVVKVITNACYGYAGWSGARWYLKPVAEAVAAWGRAAISKAQDKAMVLGLDVIYSDTDSLFVRYNAKKIKVFIKEIEDELRLEIKPDKIYKRIFFTEAKKRYAGISYNGDLEVVGLEVVRGDWALVAKEVQEKVLEIILKEKSADLACDYIRQFLSDLGERKVPYKNLIIWKSITRSLGAYRANAPHVEAARKLTDAGYKLAIGDKIGYVIIKGREKLYTRAIPYQMATYDQVDLEYYVTNQILPPVTRVLEGFGVKEIKGLLGFVSKNGT